MAWSMASSFSPDGPARGLPSFSSYSPGASVTIMMSARGLPEEKTGVSRREFRFLRGGQCSTSSRREASFSSSVSPSRSKATWRGTAGSSSVPPECTPLRMALSSLPKEISSTEAGSELSGTPSGWGCSMPETGAGGAEMSPRASRRASITHCLRTFRASSVTGACSTPLDNKERR